MICFLLPPIGDLLPLVREPLPFVRDLLPRVRLPLSLGRRLHATEDRRWLMVIEPVLVTQPGALALQGLIIGAELRGPASDLHRATLDLSTSSLVTPL